MLAHADAGVGPAVRYDHVCCHCCRGDQGARDGQEVDVIDFAAPDALGGVYRRTAEVGLKKNQSLAGSRVVARPHLVTGLGLACSSGLFKNEFKTTTRAGAHLERHVDAAAGHARRRHPESHRDLPGRLRGRPAAAAAHEAREVAPVPVKTTSQPRTNHEHINSRVEKPQHPCVKAKRS